jgi:hypothetical protein
MLETHLSRRANGLIHQQGSYEMPLSLVPINRIFIGLRDPFRNIKQHASLCLENIFIYNLPLAVLITAKQSLFKSESFSSVIFSTVNCLSL